MFFDYLAVVVLEICSRQKIGANHFQAIPARLVSSQHQGGRFQDLLNNRQLTLVNLEIDDFPRFRFLSREVMLYRSFESLLRQLPGFVQPGCTIKLFSVPPRHLDQFYGLAPAYFPELLLWDPPQVLVY